MKRTAEERWFTASDGVRIFYRYWPAAGGAAARGLMMLHRGHEHSRRLAHVADEVGLPEVAVFGWDQRRHGRSECEATPTMGRLIRDVDEFAAHIGREHGVAVEDLAVLGQSIGAVLAAAWVHDYAPPVRALSLAAPAFRVKLYVPFARQGLGLLHKVVGDFTVNSYVKAKALTHDPERIASYQTDPLIKRPIAVSLLLGLYGAAQRVVEDAGAITVPVQVLISGADYVVRRGPQDRFFERLGSAVKERHEFPGFFHDTLGERDRAQAMAKLRTFLCARFSDAPSRAGLLNADESGYTKREYDALTRPLPAWSPKAWNFAMTRASMKTGGRLSEGIRLGLETGFDSGSTLDYVYRNQAAGITPLGKLIDRGYLDAIGWRGIRVRRANLETLLRRAMEKTRAENRAVRILDVAAGHGRYVLETAGSADSILLRDYSDLNLEAGRRLIAEKGLADVARFERGDAFDRESIGAIRPRPTVGIVSGLYELFPENAPVRASLAGLADAMEEGGYLIYTGQPWHPQLEMIARTLPSHRDHQPWVMRRRTQSEMDELVGAAGFRKLEQLTDEWGIFTVSMAQRMA